MFLKMASGGRSGGCISVAKFFAYTRGLESMSGILMLWWVHKGFDVFEWLVRVRRDVGAISTPFSNFFKNGSGPEGGLSACKTPLHTTLKAW